MVRSVQWQRNLVIQEIVAEADLRGVVAIVRVVDTAQPSPIDRAEAHRTGLTTSIYLAAGQIECPQRLTGKSDGHDLGMRGGVVGGDDLIESLGNDLSVVDDHRAEWAAPA